MGEAERGVILINKAMAARKASERKIRKKSRPQKNDESRGKMKPGLGVVVVVALFFLFYIGSILHFSSHRLRFGSCTLKLLKTGKLVMNRTLDSMDSCFALATLRKSLVHFSMLNQLHQ